MRHLLFVGAASLSLAACASTAHGRFGDVARYSPGYAGYVMNDGDTKVILRDPLTAEKIRCREDLEHAAPALSAALDDVARDRSAHAAAEAILSPYTVVGRAAEMVADGLWYPAYQLDEIFASPQPRQIYAKARDAFVAGRYAEARGLFLVLVVNKGYGDAAIDNLPRPWVELCLYYLALSDEALHLDAEARAALRRFLSASSLEDEARYRDADDRLARLGGPRCASRADFTFAWRGPR
jgi:hypothetical protein